MTELVPAMAELGIKRIKEIKRLEKTIKEQKKLIAEMNDAVQALYCVQNGSPLIRDEKEWNAAMVDCVNAMAKARKVLK
jgi:t-SNARE complex subunit (syntaxin)